MRHKNDTKSINFLTKTQRLKNFEAAKKMALQLEPGRIKRVKAFETGLAPGTYTAATLIDGTHLVIGDSMEDIPKPTQFINGRPAIKVNLTTQLNFN